MKAFRRAVYKSGEIEEIQISCNDTLRVNGGEGIYEVEINLGTEVGTAGLQYEAFTIPDRFQLFYDNVLVADSKYVGDIPNYKDDLKAVLGLTLTVFEYNGIAFVDSGRTETIGISSADIADNSPSYPYSGKGQILFNKNKGTVQTMKLKVYGVLGSTAWNARPICPYITGITSSATVPNVNTRQFDLMYQPYSNGDCFAIDNGVIGIYYTKSTDNLIIGTTLYTDKQLVIKAKSGEYWLGRTIYKAVNGLIVDKYPCSTRINNF